MRLPNFLIVGARKAGTTALYNYLNEHPQVYMSPIKEPQFFSYEAGRPKCGYPDGLPYPLLEVNSMDAARAAVKSGVTVATFTDRDAYTVLFEKVTDELAVGEASPSYLYSKQSPHLIQSHVPMVKLIAILRNPVDRAYSDYLNAVRAGREPITDFLTAIEMEDDRLDLNFDPFWHYKRVGLYYTQLKSYFQVFNKDQIKVILNEDLRHKTLSTLQDLFRFLGIDPSFEPNWNVKHNVGGLPINRTLHRWLTTPSATKRIVRRFVPNSADQRIWPLFLSKPQLSPEDRQKVIAIYRDEILRLGELIERDLSAWLL